MSDASKTYIDLETGLSRVRGNKKLFARMLTLFVKSTEFDAFEQAITAGDNDKAAEVAHGIKGMTGNLGMTELFETSNELMVQLREGDADPALLQRYRQAVTGTHAQAEALIPELEA